MLVELGADLGPFLLDYQSAWVNVASSWGHKPGGSVERGVGALVEPSHLQLDLVCKFWRPSLVPNPRR